MTTVGKVFNKYLLIALALVLVLATVVKIQDGLAESPDNRWNRRSLERIDRLRYEFSFAVFGDNQNSTGVFNDLIERVNRDDVGFALDNGDLVFDGETPKYRFFINQAKKLNKPLLTGIGNHDISGNGRDNYNEIFGPFYYSFTVGGSYFIVLDDANEDDVDPWQMDWLKAELDRSRAYANRFIFMHVPLYDRRTSGFGLGHALRNKKAARELNVLFDRYHVTMVFASHIHGFEKGTWGKTPYIITGGAGGELSGTDPRHYFFHYVRVSVTGEGVSYDVVKLKAPSTILERIASSTWIYAYSFMAVHYPDTVILLVGIYLLFALFHYRAKRKRRTGVPPHLRPAPPEGEEKEGSPLTLL